MLKDFKARLYQETIFYTASLNNTLVVLPTGLGKTAISMMLAVQRLQQYPNSKILILAPTKPLVQQHMKTFEKHVPDTKGILLTGVIKPEKRVELWKEAQIIFSTPQGLENDIIGDKISITDVSLIVFDECHKAVGDYSYVWIAKRYNELARFPRILGMSASPGADLEKITEVTNNLFIESVEVRDENDSDVKDYVQKMNIEWKQVELPYSFKQIKKLMHDCKQSKLLEIKRYGLLNRITMNKTEMLKFQGQLAGMIRSKDKNYEAMKAISLMAQALKIEHGIELIETQGIKPLHEYLKNLQRQAISSKVKAVKNLVMDPNFKTAAHIISKMAEVGVIHPKIVELKKTINEFVKENPDSKAIIFTQYRDSCSDIVQEINKDCNVTAEMFVGQAKKKDKGLSQKEQINLLERFRNGEFKILVSSSVGEEGLDIPQVDLVVFYEPIPSAVRTIQRRGRTGRMKEGKTVVLVAKETRDEGYRWAAHHKEKRMKRILTDLKIKFEARENIRNKNSDLKKFLTPEVKIICDYREKGSKVIKKLIELGSKIDLQKMEVGDYALSERVGIEFKKVDDFVNSIIDGRLLSQLRELKRTYERSIIIVEGEEDLYTVRNIHPNAIKGMMSTIVISYGIPILFTKNHNETAEMIMGFAKKEQSTSGKEFSLHFEKRITSVKEQQEYIISALPGIGATLSKPLLERLGSIRNIVNANISDLKEVELIGPKKAKAIKDLVEAKYEK